MPLPHGAFFCLGKIVLGWAAVDGLTSAKPAMANTRAAKPLESKNILAASNKCIAPACSDSATGLVLAAFSRRLALREVPLIQIKGYLWPVCKDVSTPGDVVRY